jgi:hypothetical protein
VIVLAVRWYLRFGLSYRDVEELSAASTWITSLCTDGCSDSARTWPTRLGSVGTAGTWTRPT